MIILSCAEHLCFWNINMSQILNNSAGSLTPLIAVLKILPESSKTRLSSWNEKYSTCCTIKSIFNRFPKLQLCSAKQRWQPQSKVSGPCVEIVFVNYFESFVYGNAFIFLCHTGQSRRYVINLEKDWLSLYLSFRKTLGLTLWLKCTVIINAKVSKCN